MKSTYVSRFSPACLSRSKIMRKLPTQQGEDPKKFTADTARLSDCHRRRQCRNRRMDADAMSGSRPGRKLDAVEIERMAGGGVGKRRCGGAAFETRSNDGRLFAAARLLEIFLQDSAAILARACEHGANSVCDQRLCPEHNLVRQRVKAALVDEADDIFGHTHFMLLIIMQTVSKSPLAPLFQRGEILFGFEFSPLTKAD